MQVMRLSVNKPTQSQWEELSVEIQWMWFDMQVMMILVGSSKHNLQKSKPELDMKFSGT
jgi:hypothetical protein